MSPTDITLLGSTGALGRRVLGVLLGAPDRFRVVGLAAGTQGDRLEAQADRCEARFGARPRGGLGEAALRDLAAAAELTDHPSIIELVRQRIALASENLADFERIKKFQLLPHELTIEGGELTPTLKVRRKIIQEK